MAAKKNDRRQFLKNTSLTALGIAAISKMGAVVNSHKKPEQIECNTTTLDYYGQGPFYTPNPPLLSNGQLAQETEPGTRMIISGRIHNIGCTEFIPETLIDIWQANDAGAYDNLGYNLRGKIYSNEQGFYLFETIQPGKYLNGGTYRPSHIHFKITPPGFPVLTTQLYFEGDTSIPGDAAASITSGSYDASHRIIPLTQNGQGMMEGTWDIVVDGNGVSGLQDIHLDKGMIYSASPNPYANNITIRYGVFRNAKVSLSVFDLNGNEVAILEERALSPEKYEAVWNPDSNLPAGHYFLVLKVNDLQVHYKKILRQK